MKHNKFPQNQIPASASGASAAAFAPSSDEVAKRAYFSYVSEGSLPGHDLENWLQAESQLIAEGRHDRAQGIQHKA